MIYAAPDYPAEPERDADELYENHRDAERGADSLLVGTGQSTRPPVERRAPHPAAGCSPLAAGSALAGGES